MHDVAWRGMWICVRSKDAQKQLARTSLSGLHTANLSWQTQVGVCEQHKNRRQTRLQTVGVK